MIGVSLSYLVLIYLVLMVVPVLGAWMLNEWRRKGRERIAFRNVFRCNICAIEFSDTSGSLLARCPHCGSLNERFRPSRL
jgi:hypothetical protein